MSHLDAWRQEISLARQSRPVPGECRRQSASWSDVLRLATGEGDTHTTRGGKPRPVGLEDRARAARRVLAVRRRMRQDDHLATVLRDRVQAPVHESAALTHRAGLPVGQRVRLAEVTIDGQRVQIDGRWLDARQSVHPESIGRKMLECRRMWSVHPTTGPDGPTWLQIPHDCDGITCRTCGDHHALSQAGRSAPPAVAYAREGCIVVAVTLTQCARIGAGPWPVCHDDPGVVRARMERARAEGPGGPQPELLQPNGGGETFGASLARLKASQRGMRQERAYGRGPGAAIVAEWWGYETTGFAPRGPHAGLPRAHTHPHGVIVLRPGTDVDAWWTAYRAAWLRHTDGEAGQQRMRVVSDGTWTPLTAPAVERAIGHALKYPGKLGDMTTAQIVEFAASWKGLHRYETRGTMVANSKIGRVARGIAVAHELETLDAEQLDTGEATAAECIERAGLPEEPTAEDLAAATEALGELGVAHVRAWRARIRVGHDRAPVEGTEVVLFAGTPRILTRGILFMALRTGRTIWAARHPDVLITAAQVQAEVRDGWAPTWRRLDPARVLAELGHQPPRGPP